MIYPTLMFLILVFTIMLFLKRKIHVSIAIITGSLIASSMLFASIIPQVKLHFDNYMQDSPVLNSVLPYSPTSYILFGLIMLLIGFSEITFFSENKHHEVNKDSQTLIFLGGIFAGLFIFSTNLFILTILMFALPLTFFFSRVIYEDNYNFSFVFWRTMGAMTFLVATVLVLNTQMFKSVDITKVFVDYFKVNNYTSLSNFEWTPTSIISLLFMASVLFIGTLFPTSHIFTKKIGKIPTPHLLTYSILNVLLIALVVKFKTFNPLLIELIAFFAIINILLHSVQTLRSRSLSTLAFNTHILITSFTILGVINLSEDCFYASIYLFTVSMLIYICLILAISSIKRKRIPIDIDDLSLKRIAAPRACVTVATLVILFTLPIGPYFLGILTILTEVTKSADYLMFIAPLPFLISTWAGLYILYKLFFNKHESYDFNDVGVFELAPIFPLLILIAIAMLSHSKLIPFNQLIKLGAM